MKSLLVLLLALGVGCAGTTNTSSRGESSASLRTGNIVTTTTTATALDGTTVVTVVETCEGCAEEESVGGAGSDKFYKTAITIGGMFLSVASIVIQVLR